MVKTRRLTFTGDFRQEAVRLIAMSGRALPQIAEDLGVELSSLSRGKQKFDDADLLGGSHEDETKELARLRKENETFDRNTR